MRKTAKIENVNKFLINTKELQGMCGCGRETALKIGIEAKARVQIGKRVLWNVAKVQSYINDLAERDLA